MSSPVEKLAQVLKSLNDMRTESRVLDNAQLALRLTALSEAYAQMQEEIANQAKELASLRDQVAQMVEGLEDRIAEG
jgi:phage host-nuclease inhibitor protein Gam